MHRPRTLVFPDLSPQRMSSPTCEELGIPQNNLDAATGLIDECNHQLHLHTHHHRQAAASSPQQDPSYQVFTDVSNDVRRTASISGQADSAEKKNDPFSPSSLIPLPDQIVDFECGLEPAFIRKRNERERERVRCVNEGYIRLKKHLPIQQQEKRISKVETLRAAIQYIRSLQDILQGTNTRKKVEPWTISNTEHAPMFKSHLEKR